MASRFSGNFYDINYFHANDCDNFSQGQYTHFTAWATKFFVKKIRNRF